MELLDRLDLKPGLFDGQVAVVTGAARGIGEQVARGLAHLGAHCILLDVRESGEGAAARIRGNARSAAFKQVDLTDLEALDRVQREILEESHRVDILVNNASKHQLEYFLRTPLARWDELYQTTLRASAFLISKFLPAMKDRGAGVICNTIAAEGLSHDAPFSSAMVGQRSMVLSLAGELGSDSEVSVLGFAPGVVDTPLVTELAPRFAEFHHGMSLEDFAAKGIRNPGYEGLMPVEHCGASYVYCLAHAREYHGQIADAFHPLINAGIITPKEADKEPVDSLLRETNDYIQGISSVNRNLEKRIEERTRDLEAANQQLAHQKRLMEEVSAKLSRYLPQQVYQSLFEGELDAEISSQRKHLSVFFSDIRDFTRRTERLEPEAMSEILNLYFSAMTEIARSHGATIDKFIGDAILAFFGDPHSEGREADAESCVRMAMAMQTRMGELAPEFHRLGLQEPLEIRIAINSGYCTVGNFGSYDRMDYTVIGSPVNIAARLQGVAEPGAILVSGTTHALIAERFEFGPKGRVALKGIAEEVDSYEVRQAAETPAAPGATAQDLTDLRSRLAGIDLTKVDEAEAKALLQSMSRLLGKEGG